MKRLLLLLVAAVLPLTACVLRPLPFDEAAWRAEVEKQDPAMLYAPHVKDGRFFNPWSPSEHKGFFRMLRWRLSRRQEYTPEERQFMPGFREGLKDRIRSLPGGDFIAWIGHGTFLMRAGGQFWLTDPMFSDRALLPKRKTPPAITAKEVGELGGTLNVIVSHNHYDHFDKASIRDLPPQARVFVPLGMREAVRRLGKENIVEMDWWQEEQLGDGVRIVCLPAQHWSRRLSQGINRALWASFLIVTPEMTVYYGGDSGYFIGYREIGRKFPAIDYALLPVTAYQPRWFMHYAHVDAAESIDAFRDLGARFFIPTQWGTFPLGDEPVGYGIVDLKKKMASSGTDLSRFIIMDLGEIVTLERRASAATFIR